MNGEHYQIGNLTSYSPYGALRKSKDTHHFAEFVIPQWHHDAWQGVNVEKIKNADPAELIKNKIQHVFAKHKDLTLTYSGGTDSQTILQYAMEQNLVFDRIFCYTTSILENDPYNVDEETQIPRTFLNSHTDCAKEVLIGKLTVDDYERWLDPALPYYMPNMEFGLRTNWYSVWVSKYGNPNCIVNGNAKPHLIKKNDRWFWIYYDATPLYSNYEHCDIFLDGVCPEVAINQVYRCKQWYEKNLKDLNGPIDINLIPYDNRESWHRHLGRAPSLSKELSIGTLYGKTHNPFNEKHRRAFKELCDLDRLDIIESWQNTAQQIIKEFTDMPHSIKVYSVPSPSVEHWDQDILIPVHINRISFVYELEETAIRRLDSAEIHELMNS